MKWTLPLLLVACTAFACSDSPVESVPDVQDAVPVEPSVVIDYSDWSADQTGTTAKPAFGKGCRYRAGEGSVWALASDGANDRVSIFGDAAGEIVVSFEARSGGVSVFETSVTYERVLSGKAYYRGSGSITFEGEAWDVVDGTLCFESSIATSTTAVAAEFSLIASRDSGARLRTVGGTFVLPADKMGTGAELAIDDDAIALTLP